jgi:endoglucanase
MLKKQLIFIFVALALSQSFGANFTSTHGKLSVSNGKILNKNNQEIVLRGMSFYWYQGFWAGSQPGDNFYTSSAVSELANNWNASVVRAAIGNVTRKTDGTSNVSGAVAKAKEMMDWASNNGVYVIIDNHSHIAHRASQTSNVNSFFTQVSAYVKQKSYTHVLYEIYNEPYCDSDDPEPANCGSTAKTTWAQIKSFAQPIITAIRANDPDGLIIVGTPGYSSGIGSARQDPFTGTYAKNVLYTLHFYAGESGHSNYKDALKGAYCANFPVFATEWGVTGASGSGSVNTQNSGDWLSLLEAAKVSNANWSFSNAGGSSAALSGTSVTGGLTTSGNYVKNIISKLNSNQTLANAGLTAKTIDCSSPPPPAGPDGRIEFGYAGSMLNFASKNGADSVNAAGGWALANTSANFTADYTLFNIPKAGTYIIAFSLASTAGGTVSWSGSGIASGQMQYQSTGSLDTFKYTEKQKITINQAPETPLHISFQTSSANSLRARNVYVDVADSADSVKLNISTTPVQKLLKENKNWNYNAATKTFSFEKSEGTLSIVNLRGEKLRLFAAKGTVYLNDLPAGVYIAIYKHGSETAKKTVYLK